VADAAARAAPVLEDADLADGLRMNSRDLLQEFTVEILKYLARGV